MPRHYIGVTSRGPTTLRNVLLDRTGQPLLLVNEVETTKLVIDYSDWLDASETISSATVTADNASVSISTSSPQITLTISAVTSPTYGKATIIVTTSTSQVRRETIWIRRASRFTDEQQYRDYA